MPSFNVTESPTSRDTGVDNSMDTVVSDVKEQVDDDDPSKENNVEQLNPDD